MVDEEGRIWPDNPKQHIMAPPKPRGKITSKYKYNNKNVFFKIYSCFLRGLALIFLPLYNKIVYHHKVIGYKNLFKANKKGLIVISNHVLHMDSAMISTALFKTRRLNIMMLSETATIPVAGNMIKALGGFPIADDLAGAKKFYEYCNNLLQNNKPILIFPETAMWHGYKGLRPFDKGAFKIAVKNNVPILPVVITLKNRGKIKQKQKYKVYLHILPAITPDETIESAPKRVEDLSEKVYSAMKNKMDDFYKKLKEKTKSKKNTYI